MSPRFDRRPEKRTGGGARGAGRPPRFSGPKPEWRRDGAGEDREGSRDARRDPGGPAPRGASRYQPRRDGGADRPSSRGERRPFERRNDSDRPAYGERRPDRFSGDRGAADSKPYDRRPGGRFEGRPQGRRPDAAGSPDGRRFAGRRPDGPRFEGRRADGGRIASGRFEAGRFEGGRPSPGRFSPKPLIVDADSLPPSGDAERHSVDPSTDLIWGRHPAQAALESGRPIHRVWCTPEMRFSPKFLQLLREAKASGVLVEEVTWARLGQITGGAVHQGIALQTAAAETLDLPTLLEGCAGIGEPPLLMAVDGLTDPQNLGAIVRSAEALGAHGLVLPQRRSAGLTGSVAKVAAGALEHLPVARVVNLNRALDTLKQEGYRVVGLAAEGTVSLEEADLEGPLVIVTGSEGDGLSMLTRRNCDQLVRIPLRGATPSLNASVATALLLYEVARRGWMKGLRGSQPAPRLVRPQLPAPAAETAEMATEMAAELVTELVAEPEVSPLALEEAPPIAELAAEELPVAAWMPPEDEAPVADPGVNETTLDLGLTPAGPAGFNGDIQL
ncbi:23S rRNA (guanosine(2251)-2'-O)-methyltransferase RlmB [Synechococcus sp. 8F6]|uniref:23S rRNA (guanosine(2251)-2'-O)-methyltransferase RlmB n=1 Tax=Synechococcus sp. 8F6 TaxID=2025606 RepID=UPI000B97CB40|nr:23S rRNA (guanosine(2251)-2'-O)-methyltransferase RlmB [Synechococcus sp. 8F6]